MDKKDKKDKNGQKDSEKLKQDGARGGEKAKTTRLTPAPTPSPSACFSTQEMALCSQKGRVTEGVRRW